MIKHPIGIFISGRGSNLKSIVDACKEQEYPAEIRVVFSNNKNAPGLSFAKENNLDTCAQESWALFHKLVHKQVKAPKEYMLFCGIAIGHMDKTNVINKIRTERANIDDLAEFFGFED